MPARGGQHLFDEAPRRGFGFPFWTMPRSHFEFHAIAALAAIAAAMHLFQAVGCADSDVVDRTSEIIKGKSDGAANVTLLMIRKLSGTPNELACAAFARFEYADKESTHRDIEYRIAIRPDHKDVSASILPSPE